MDIKEFLRNNVIPATGCTEPAAVAYATSVAYHALCNSFPPDFSGPYAPPQPGKLPKIGIMTDKNVYKNALNVIVPGTDRQKGLPIAAAAGIFLDPRKGLDVFSGMTPDIRDKASFMTLNGHVVTGMYPNDTTGPSPDIRAEVTLKTHNQEKTSIVHITGRHNYIAEIQIDGVVCYSDPQTSDPYDDPIPDSISDLVALAESMDPDETDEVYKGIEMNMTLAEAGRDNKYGVALGMNFATILRNQKGMLSLIDEVRVTAANAGDARMGGAPCPVMSSAGSGNQGITALIPVAVIGRECKFSKEEICRAALISHLFTRKVDLSTGHLSALCGCSLKAGIGATAGVTYLIGGGPNEITTAVNLLMGTITGTICDGAKAGCSLKISNAAGIATECAFMAVGGMKIPADNGIIRKNFADTLQVLERISCAMALVDTEIVQILKEKSV